ncbi:oxidoreductase [Bacillus sp. OK048]|uniref:oxidoreductase n=1 Tax=Bacillus sp. OK048 TaxID=1882761 RepID=UPI00087E0502|nr:oxidoreductase [Bacillus sp. OK048]SDM38951.1 Short-chain dehydrogenase [Bacillus sp. OK048]
MNDKIAIVTGTTSGFGLITSIELARKGYTVFATVRNSSKSADLIQEARKYGVESKIIVHVLDVTDEKSIQTFQSRVIEDVGRVDVLINNAGFAGAGFVEEISMEEYRKQFETNVFGVFAVTKAFLPLMRKQGQGCIINISSISGKVAFPGLSPYIASKHAIEGWSESLRLEMQPFGVKVVLIEPGSYKTNIWSPGKQVAVESMKSYSPYQDYMQSIERYIGHGEDSFGDPLEVAKKIAEIAGKKNPKMRYPIGRGVKASILLKNLLPWRLWEKIIISKLFEK